MGMTLGEKIIARAAGVDFVKPNDIHTVRVDFWRRFTYHFLRSIRSVWYRGWMYRFFICDDNRNILGYGS